MLWLGMGCTQKTLDNPAGKAPGYYFDSKASEALVSAAQSGNIATLEKLVQSGADVDVQGRHGATPLMLVLLSGSPPLHKKGFDKLLDLGADWSLAEEHGRSVVHLAASRQDDPFWLKSLIEHEADLDIVNTSNNEITTPLQSAIASGATKNAKLLVMEGADVDKPNGNGECPLLFAALRNQWNIALLLLQSGAQVNQPLPNGKSSVKSFILERPSSLVKAFPNQIESYEQVITFLERSGDGNE